MITNDTTIIAIANVLNTNFHTDLIDICRSLAKLDINAFFYSSFYEMNRVNILSNNFTWLQHLQHHLHHYNFRFENTFHFRPGFSIDFLNYFSANKMTQDMIQFGMKNAIYLTNVSKDRKYSEVFIFTTADSCELSNQRLSDNVDHFNQFCFGFKDKASTIIKKTRIPRSVLSESITVQNDTVKKNVSTNIKRYYLGSPYDDIYLTVTEFKYLKEYLCGRPTKSIASLYSVSSRTIEKSLVMIKEKLDCHNKNDLLEKISFSQLFYPVFCK